MTFPLITVEADKMGGQPCIRGMRIPVATVVTMVAVGMTVDEILADLPELEAEDVAEALRYSAEAVRDASFPFVSQCEVAVDENLSRRLPQPLRAYGHEAEHIGDGCGAY